MREELVMYLGGCIHGKGESLSVSQSVSGFVTECVASHPIKRRGRTCSDGFFLIIVFTTN